MEKLEEENDNKTTKLSVVKSIKQNFKDKESN